MPQAHLYIAIGTAASMLAVLLVLLRTTFHGRRPFVALTRLWVAARPRTSGLVVGLLAVIAAVSFALIGADGPKSDLSVHASEPSGPDDSLVDTQALDSLRAYADKIGNNPQPATTAPPDAKQAGVPDVNTMIAQLVARLKTQPGDLKGWKMLGWSYLNMDMPEEAARAYETALKLAPTDPEIKAALDQAKSAHQAAAKTPMPGSKTAPEIQ